MRFRGKPIIENGEVVGGQISAKISWSSILGCCDKEYPYEKVSLERWKSFVHKSIKLNMEKKSEFKKMEVKIFDEILCACIDA
ncbi:MAG: hypothetical protein IKW39_03775 [Alphaproteobacteria bacterium]|nr:hypothetical protein [Alphaproteobacteria bacterium]